MKRKNFSISVVILGATLCLVASGCNSLRLEKKDCEKYSNRCALKITTKWGDDYWNVNAGQQIINIRTAEWAAITEAELFLAYYDLLAHLDFKHQKSLVAEQMKWMRTRDFNAKTEANQFEGGTLWLAEYSAFRGCWNSRRLQELEHRLDQFKAQNSRTMEYECTPFKINWFPSVFILTSDEGFWADEIVKRDKYRTWRHWAEFQDMKLRVAYAYLQLNLSAKAWQPVTAESQSWPEEKAELLKQATGNAEPPDKELGRAAAKRFDRLRAQFPMLDFEPK